RCLITYGNGQPRQPRRCLAVHFAAPRPRTTARTTSHLPIGGTRRDLAQLSVGLSARNVTPNPHSSAEQSLVLTALPCSRASPFQAAPSCLCSAGRNRLLPFVC